MRNAVKETAGEILIDKDNYVTIGEYVDSTEQQPWIREANNGKLYHDILTSHYSKKYNTAITVGSGKCQTPSAETGDWAAWRQYDPKWGNQKLCASATISKSGCAMTATAMQLARSGVSYTVNGELNPGTFVEAMQKNGGETNCNIVWGAVTNIAPGLKYDPNWAIAFKSSTTDKEKYDTVSKAIDAGCYVVLEVDRFNGKGHWVAVTGTDNGEIKMADPAGDTTDVFSKYGKGPSEIVCYKKTG